MLTSSPHIYNLCTGLALSFKILQDYITFFCCCSTNTVPFELQDYAESANHAIIMPCLFNLSGNCTNNPGSIVDMLYPLTYSAKERLHEGDAPSLITSVMNRGSVGKHATTAWNFSPQRNYEANMLLNSEKEVSICV